MVLDTGPVNLPEMDKQRRKKNEMRDEKNCRDIERSSHSCGEDKSI